MFSESHQHSAFRSTYAAHDHPVNCFEKPYNNEHNGLLDLIHAHTGNAKA